MTTKVIVKSWDEMLKVGKKVSDTTIELNTECIYTIRMHHLFLEANFIVNITPDKQLTDYDFECVDYRGYFLSKEMIKRKACNNEYN